MWNQFTGYKEKMDKEETLLYEANKICFVTYEEEIWKHT